MAPVRSTPPAKPVEDTASDLLDTGLRKFNLGSVPASVMPDKSWRPAMWFSLCASAIALATIAGLSSTLVSSPTSEDMVKALPAIPSNIPDYLQNGTSSPFVPRSSAPHKKSTTGKPSKVVLAPDPTRPTRTVIDVVTDTINQPSMPQSPTPSGTPSSISSTPSSTQDPKVSIESTSATPTADGKQMASTTQAYYDAVVSDPSKAYAMTSGQLHDDGEAALAQKYAGIAKIQISQIDADPNSGTTTNDVTFTKKDGSTYSETRTLTFNSDRTPKITNDNS
jgi:hypothetical protein